ncbi:MAG: collagen-like protein [Candidatus Paceibacterota bacterium]
MTATKIKPLLLDTLLAMLRRSVGTKMFQTNLATVAGRKKDVTGRGSLSCAFYVSAILAIFGLIDHNHSEVASTVTAMTKAGWRKSQDLKPGRVIVWARPTGSSGQARPTGSSGPARPTGSSGPAGRPGTDGRSHEHIGFYLGDNRAISHSDKKRSPVIHHFTFGRTTSRDYRPLTAIYYHPKLG